VSKKDRFKDRLSAIANANKKQPDKSKLISGVMGTETKTPEVIEQPVAAQPAPVIVQELESSDVKSAEKKTKTKSGRAKTKGNQMTIYLTPENEAKLRGACRTKGDMSLIVNVALKGYLDWAMGQIESGKDLTEITNGINKEYLNKEYDFFVKLGVTLDGELKRKFKDFCPGGYLRAMINQAIELYFNKK
jgi:hypothetical protein